jgi:AcrR family transcriptional regulator
LSKLPAGRQRLPRQFVEQNQRDRILLAALDVFGERGYAAPTVQDLVTASSMSRATFYKHFADKEACFRAVHAEVLAWLEERARDAAMGAEGWASAVRAVCERLIVLLDDDPRLARICTVEWILAGDAVRSRHEAALERLAGALRQGRAERPGGKHLPRCLELFVLAGAMSVASRTIVYDREPDAKALVRELPEVLLVPYLGAEEARRAARRPG